MSDQPISKKFPGWNAVAGLLLTGGALVLEPISGLGSLLSRLAGLGAFGFAESELRRLGARVANPNERIAALEGLGLATIRLSGHSLELLGLCVLTESKTLFCRLDVEEAKDALSLTDSEFKEAAEDLEDLGLATIDVDLSHPTGIRRVALTGAGFLSAAPSLLADVDVISEIHRILSRLRETSTHSVLVPVAPIITGIGIPVARFELIARGLEEQGLVSGSGPGTMDTGSYMYLELTAAGRRLLGSGAT